MRCRGCVVMLRAGFYSRIRGLCAGFRCRVSKGFIPGRPTGTGVVVLISRGGHSICMQCIGLGPSDISGPYVLDSSPKGSMSLYGRYVGFQGVVISRL